MKNLYKKMKEKLEGKVGLSGIEYENKFKVKIERDIQGGIYVYLEYGKTLNQEFVIEITWFEELKKDLYILFDEHDDTNTVFDICETERVIEIIIERIENRTSCDWQN